MASWAGEDRRKADRRSDLRGGRRRTDDIRNALRRKLDTGPRTNGDLKPEPGLIAIGGKVYRP